MIISSLTSHLIFSFSYNHKAIICPKYKYQASNFTNYFCFNVPIHSKTIHSISYMSYLLLGSNKVLTIKVVLLYVQYVRNLSFGDDLHPAEWAR